MSDRDEPSPHLLHALSAALLALLGAGFWVEVGCRGATTDQCLMTKGFTPHVWGMLFIVLWPVCASIGRAWRRSKHPGDGVD